MLRLIYHIADAVHCIEPEAATADPKRILHRTSQYNKLYAGQSGYAHDSEVTMITGIRVNGNTYDAQSTKVICMNASDSIVHVTSGKYAYEVQTGTPLDVQGNTVSIGADISVK